MQLQLVAANFGFSAIAAVRHWTLYTPDQFEIQHVLAGSKPTYDGISSK